MVNITHTPESHCPNCKRVAGHIEDYTPKENDLSICLYCQAILVFNKDLILRILTEEEFNSFPADFQEYITFERFRCRVIMGKTNPEMN